MFKHVNGNGKDDDLRNIPKRARSTNNDEATQTYSESDTPNAAAEDRPPPTSKMLQDHKIKKQMQHWAENVSKMPMTFHPLSNFSPKSPSNCFSTKWQISVLDRGTNSFISLSTALASRELRHRAGLFIALFDGCQHKYTSQLRKAILQKTELSEIWVSVLMWNPVKKDLGDFGRMLDETVESYSDICHWCVRVERRSQPLRDPKSVVIKTWPMFVSVMDIEGYYLKRLSEILYL